MLFYKLGLACKVKYPQDGKIIEIYKIWKYNKQSDMFHKNPLLDTLPDFIYEKVKIKWVRMLMLDIRYRKNKKKYNTFLEFMRKVLFIKEYNLTKEEEKTLDKLKKELATKEEYYKIILKNYERLHDDNRKDGKFIMNYTDIPEAMNKYLETLTIDKAKDLIK